MYEANEEKRARRRDNKSQPRSRTSANCANCLVMGKNSKRNKRARNALEKKLRTESVFQQLDELTADLEFHEDGEVTIDTASPEDWAARMRDNAETYLKHRAENELTPQWRDWAKRHEELIETVAWQEAVGPSPERR